MASALIAYRIADARHKIFDATGALLQGGRWNSPGRAVIYAALSYAGAMLELLAHANIGRIPVTQEYVVITIPPRVRVERRDRAGLPKGWDHDDCVISRGLGDAWLQSMRSAVLLVPSVVAEIEMNVLLNPMHAQFRLVRVSRSRPVKWDTRLFQRSSARTAAERRR